eukprot:Hpha_TRINITY_DN16818_c0_g17::TRINITY_DN16818_c0_g17_i1::g.148371::m.148371/K03312/gltS; glutamate:Na+ symporter, ESS family
MFNTPLTEGRQPLNPLNMGDTSDLHDLDGIQADSPAPGTGDAPEGVAELEATITDGLGPHPYARQSKCTELTQAKVLAVCFCTFLTGGAILGLMFSEEITRKGDEAPADERPPAQEEKVSVNPLLPFCLLAFFLFCGTVLRIQVPFFAKTFIPASVIGGFSLLAFGQIWNALGGTKEFEIVSESWRAVPPFAINIVFATMFIGRHISSPRKVWFKCNTQFVYGQLLGFGQYSIGLSWGTLMGWAFSQNRSFGLVLPVGFEGGYSVALGLEASFTNEGWAKGADLAVASATTGLLAGTLMGIGMLNWYHRRQKAIPGFEYVPTIAEGLRVTDSGEYELKEVRKENRRQPGTGAPTRLERERLREQRMHEMKTMTFFPPDRQGPSTFVVLQPVMVDNFSYHLCLAALAVFFGYTTKSILSLLDPAVEYLITIPQFFRSFPTFPFSLLGGLLIQLVLQKGGSSEKVDRNTFERLQRMSLDFLIVSAIASVSTSALKDAFFPFLLLMFAGILYHFCMAMFFSHWFFGDNEFWFERAIVEMGQSMGDTSTGLLLLGIVDPTDHSGVAATFAYSRLLYEPILGGGIWTSTVIPLVGRLGPLPVLGIAVTLWIFFFFVWKKLLKTHDTDRVTLDRLQRMEQL